MTPRLAGRQDPQSDLPLLEVRCGQLDRQARALQRPPLARIPAVQGQRVFPARGEQDHSARLPQRLVFARGAVAEGVGLRAAAGDPEDDLPAPREFRPTFLACHLLREAKLRQGRGLQFQSLPIARRGPAALRCVRRRPQVDPQRQRGCGPQVRIAAIVEHLQPDPTAVIQHASVALGKPPRQQVPLAVVAPVERSRFEWDGDGLGGLRLLHGGRVWLVAGPDGIGDCRLGIGIDLELKVLARLVGRMGRSLLEHRQVGFDSAQAGQQAAGQQDKDASVQDHESGLRSSPRESDQQRRTGRSRREGRSGRRTPRSGKPQRAPPRCRSSDSPAPRTCHPPARPRPRAPPTRRSTPPRVSARPGPRTTAARNGPRQTGRKSGAWDGP